MCKNKSYTIVDNNVIINPNTNEELNITEEGLECCYCKYNSSTCGRYHNVEDYGYCDYFTILSDYKEA